VKLKEAFARKQGKFERLFNRYFKQVRPIDEDEGGYVYDPIDGVMITHDGELVTRIATDTIGGDDGDDTIHIGYETGWLAFSREDLSTPEHQFVLWKKTNY